MSHFIEDNRTQLQARGELLTEKLRHDIAERQKLMKENAGRLATDVFDKLPQNIKDNVKEASAFQSTNTPEHTQKSDDEEMRPQ